ncbi:unnamed protein product, partial [Owenia fusiformis]
TVTSIPEDDDALSVEIPYESHRKLGQTKRNVPGEIYGTCAPEDAKRRRTEKIDKQATNSSAEPQRKRYRDVICARWQSEVFLGVKERDTVFYCKQALSTISDFNSLMRITNKMRVINRGDYAKIGEEIPDNHYFVVQDRYLDAPKNNLVILLKESEEQVLSYLSSLVAQF